MKVAVTIGLGVKAVNQDFMKIPAINHARLDVRMEFVIETGDVHHANRDMWDLFVNPALKIALMAVMKTSFVDLAKRNFMETFAINHVP